MFSWNTYDETWQLRIVYTPSKVLCGMTNDLWSGGVLQQKTKEYFADVVVKMHSDHRFVHMQVFLAADEVDIMFPLFSALSCMI